MISYFFYLVQARDNLRAMPGCLRYLLKDI